MKTKELINEWKAFLNKDILNEVSFKEFQRTYPEFETSQFSSQLRGNTDYLDIIKNSIEAGQNHSPEDYIQQFEFYKNSIQGNRRNENFLTVTIPGEDDSVSLVGKLNPGSYTATYDDIQEFQQARMFVLGKASANKLTSAYTKILEEASTSDFELIISDKDWIVCYPKTIKGSIALARSYWDGTKLSYDRTFNTSRGFGKNTGIMKWCTSVSGGGNMFLNYHRRMNLHMYYCIKKDLNSLGDPGRKLCISFSKKYGKVILEKGSSSVNGNNSSMSKEEFESHIGEKRLNILFNDAKKPERLEIDEKAYYTSISLEQYKILRSANEENIKDFTSEFRNILKYSKDSDKIAINAAQDPMCVIKIIVAENQNTPLEVMQALAEDEDPTIRQSIAKNQNTPLEVMQALAEDEDPTIRQHLAKNQNIPLEIMQALAKDEDPTVRQSIAENENAPLEIIQALAKDEDPNVRQNLVGVPNTTIEIMQALAEDEDPTVRAAAAFSPSLTLATVQALARDEDSEVRDNVTSNPNMTPEILLLLSRDKDSSVRRSVASSYRTSLKALRLLAKDEDPIVRQTIADNLYNQNITPEILLLLSRDKDSSVRQAAANNPNTPKKSTFRSSLRDYIRARLNLN